MARKKKTGVLAVAGSPKKNLTIDDDEYEQPQENAPVLNAVTDEVGASEKVSDDHDQGFILVETKKKKKKKNKEEDEEKILEEAPLRTSPEEDEEKILAEHGHASPVHVEPISEEKVPLEKEEENPNLARSRVESRSEERKKKDKKEDLFTGSFSVLDDDDDHDDDEDEDEEDAGSKEEEESEIREKDSELERIEAEKKKSKREKKKKRMLMKKKLMVTADERILSPRRHVQQVTIACLSAGLMITTYFILSSHFSS